MSLRPHPEDLHAMDSNGARSPEIHHPRPTRPPQLQRRVTISTDADNDEQQSPTWRHYAPANAALNTEKLAQSTEGSTTEVTRNVIQRPPSAPPALNHPPPTPTTIHPILAVRSILRAHARMRLAWDIRFSPDAPTVPVRMRANHRYSTGAISTVSTITHGRPRSNTQPQADLAPDLELASDMTARLNYNYNSVPAAATGTGTGTGAFADHSLALEPATTPPRPRMLIVCRDLLPWLIPVYARDPEVGCTVIDVVRGIYNALQVSVEVAGQMRSGGEGQAQTQAQPRMERRRVDWLRDKTLFVCLGRDEALARRRLPGRANLWSEVFVLTLARREQR
ncbi:hypothetical protein FRC09_006577 [Ceratobasidium sp. 395]|nr:hypothetical protein FRC09_006577 [Ceratobasidium sp. 395]